MRLTSSPLHLSLSSRQLADSLRYPFGRRNYRPVLCQQHWMGAIRTSLTIGFMSSTVVLLKVTWCNNKRQSLRRFPARSINYFADCEMPGLAIFANSSASFAKSAHTCTISSKAWIRLEDFPRMSFTSTWMLRVNGLKKSRLRILLSGFSISSVVILSSRTFESLSATMSLAKRPTSSRTMRGTMIGEQIAVSAASMQLNKSLKHIESALFMKIAVIPPLNGA